MNIERPQAKMNVVRQQNVTKLVKLRVEKNKTT